MIPYRTGGERERWQAAFELARLLHAHPEEGVEPGLAQSVIAAFRGSRRGDPAVRRYLCLAVGGLKAAAALDDLVLALEDSDPDTRLYAIWGLGALQDARASPSLLPLLGDAEAGIRKMTAYALGGIGDLSAAPALVDLLEDPEGDVRWNAALALAQLGDASGVPILLGMADRDRLAQVPGMDERQRQEVVVNAVRGLGLLMTPEAADYIGLLSREDPSPEVRRVARELLAEAAGGAGPAPAAGGETP